MTSTKSFRFGVDGDGGGGEGKGYHTVIVAIARHPSHGTSSGQPGIQTPVLRRGRRVRPFGGSAAGLDQVAHRFDDSLWLFQRAAVAAGGDSD